jgi:hypothetical protein
MDILQDGVLLGHTQTSEVNATYGGTIAKIYTLEGPEPGYRYLAFYGVCGTDVGYIYELELTLRDGSTIDYNNNAIPSSDITLVSQTHLNNDSRYRNIDSVFDGLYQEQPATASLLFEANANGQILFSMDTLSIKDIVSGTFYTRVSEVHQITQGKIYGTNTDPSTFNAIDEANWEYVCDLALKTTPPPDPVVEPVAKLVGTGGSWNASYEYLYIETKLEGQFLYGLVDKGTTNIISNDSIYDIEYDPSDGMFYDVGDSNPGTWGLDNNGTNLSAFPTTANMETHYWYYSGSLNFQFDNPYYVAPEPEPVVEPVARLVGTDGNWSADFDWLYFKTTLEGRYLYGLVEKGSTDRFLGRTQYDVEYDPSDGMFYDIGSHNPFTWGIDDIGTNLSDLPTSTNMPIQYWYDASDNLMFQFDNPYYVA